MIKDLEKKYQDWKKKRHYEFLNYEKKRHYEFLNQDLCNLSDELKSRLRTYSGILIDQVNWEIRDQYLKFLKDFIEKKIDGFSFRFGFLERYKSIEKVANVLKLNRVLLSPNENFLDFGDVEFRASMEKIYFQMKNLLKNH
jgi:hypothetical protein